jgi:hypothetical protein
MSKTLDGGVTTSHQAGASQARIKKFCELCPKPGAFSPSQIKLFSYGCQRKWAFRHILKLPEPEQTFQELGKDVHKHNENYLKYNIEPPRDTKSGQIAHVGLAQLPKPGPNHRIEEHLYLSYGGLQFHGFADLVDLFTLTVYDYKTTSDFQWALSPEELATDPQALIYSMFVHEQTKTGGPFPLHWMYYKTREPYTLRSVKATLSIAQLHTNFSRHVLPSAYKMDDIRRVADPITYDPNELPGNAAACNAYGGLPIPRSV